MNSCISLHKSIPAKTEALVVLIHGKDSPEILSATLSDKQRKALVAAAEAVQASTKRAKISVVPAPESIDVTRVMFVGLGDDEEISDADVTFAIGAAARALAGTKRAAIELGTDEVLRLEAAAEGVLLGRYTFAKYHTPDAAPVEDVALIVPSLKGDAKQLAEIAIERCEILSDGVALARDLVNTSPSELYPESFVCEAKAAIKGLKDLSLEVMDEKALAEAGCGAIMGVGQGSANPPRMVTISYRPKGAKQHVALIGKGITFDSGGLSLKPAGVMTTMKCDMAGAAAALATIVVAAQLQIEVNVTAYLALAENMPSAKAQRPDDVVTARNGKTIEITNTDAEGRLVMADALSLAAETDAEVLIDIATLTGAAVVALGSHHFGIMGDEELRSDLAAAAQVAGELAWPMPLPKELAPVLKSPIADIANANMKVREGGMLTAGLFLKEFVGDKTWAHLDIAGPAFNSGSARGHLPAGGTGIPVRTLISYLEALEA